jgi:flavin reductase (DIM6/NTAB) family NADH-FMN oxidoreductase RutF
MIPNITQLLTNISHGVYVIGVTDGENENAFTAAWVMQVSFDPVLVALGINPKHYSYQLLQKGGVCAISVLGVRQLDLADHFGRSQPDKMAGFRWLKAETGAPILADSLAYFDCRVLHCMDAGDHKIAVCQVMAAAELHQGARLLYAQTGDIDGSSELYES